MITVGRVTQRKGAKLHHMQDGRAVCPTVNGRTAIGEGAKPLEPKHAELVCKRCRPALLTAAEMDWTRQTMETSVGYSRSRELAAKALVDALRTPAQRAAEQAAREAFAAKFYAINPDLAPAA